MPRPDLLALTPDDLAVLTNRGTVKRAQKELESGGLTAELSESADGEITATWSDGPRCTIPAGKVLSAATCDCAATEACRHVVRTVLLYQSRHAAPAAAPLEPAPSEASAESSVPVETPPPPPAGEPWDPGGIPDSALEAAFRGVALTRARTEFDAGLLVELVRGPKPSARFHDPPHTLRFLVPGDPRYTHCDCAEEPPCRHVPLAVWAFRRLDPAATSGLVTTETAPPAVPVETLDALEDAWREWLRPGLSGSPRLQLDALARLAARCRDEGLAWPADAVEDLAREQERYLDRDALFDPVRAASLLGELLVRADAIRAATGAVPQPLVRGSRSDRPVEVGHSRSIGLGCLVTLSRRSVAVTALLQDVDSGTVVGVTREFADPAAGDATPARSFHALAQTPVVKGASLAMLGAGQLMIQGAKRTPGHRLVPGRGRAVTNPQAYTWEQLRPPAFAEDFDELRARLALLPPASLRPRRVAEDFHAVAVSGVEAAGFDPASQTMVAVVTDARGNTARVEHPYHARGRDGFEAVAAALSDGGPVLKFVAGPARSGPDGLVITPTALVVEEAGVRRMIQPWVDRSPAAAASSSAALRASARTDPVSDYPGELLNALGELFLLGLDRSDARMSERWRELARYGEAVGFHRLTHPVSALAGALDARLHAPRWDPNPAAQAFLELTALVRLALDLHA